MTSQRYAEKVVIITGSSRGIGKGCAEAFVTAGSKVVVSSDDVAEGKAAVIELQKVARQPDDVTFIACDVRNPQDLESLVASSISLYGRIDCLINNAGWHPPHKPIDDFSIDEFRELIDLNLISVFAACKFALPHLRQTSGNIINIASLVAAMGQHHAATYVATKGAVASLTKALAIDEAPHGVRVNSVSPGNIYTPLWQEAINAASDPDQCRADGEAAQVMARMGTIQEVGRLCLFIAAEASFTTGVDHIISGGAELGYGRKDLGSRI